MSKKKILINATNIYYGGGARLLNDLISNIKRVNEFFFLLDQRFSITKKNNVNFDYKIIKPGFLSKLKSELWLLFTSNSGDILLNFNNLPPLFRSRAKTIVFVQNRYLVEPSFKSQRIVFIDFKILIQRILFKYLSNNVDQFIVQTPTMKYLLTQRIKSLTPVMVFPFYGIYNNAESISNNNNNKYDFVYVASGENHKNHLNLFKAWEYLAEKGHYFSVCVTLDKLRYPFLCKKIYDLNKQGILIINIGQVSDKYINRIYNISHALIYPSFFESLGLPLIEASRRNMKILAPELDYIRDIINPSETFDPSSYRSIARAVMRFKNINENMLNVFSPSRLIDFLTNY